MQRDRTVMRNNTTLRDSRSILEHILSPFIPFVYAVDKSTLGRPLDGPLSRRTYGDTISQIDTVNMAKFYGFDVPRCDVLQFD